MEQVEAAMDKPKTVLVELIPSAILALFLMILGGIVFPLLPGSNGKPGGIVTGLLFSTLGYSNIFQTVISLRAKLLGLSPATDDLFGPTFSSKTNKQLTYVFGLFFILFITSIVLLSKFPGPFWRLVAIFVVLAIVLFFRPFLSLVAIREITNQEKGTVVPSLSGFLVMLLPTYLYLVAGAVSLFLGIYFTAKFHSAVYPISAVILSVILYVSAKREAGKLVAKLHRESA